MKIYKFVVNLAFILIICGFFLTAGSLIAGGTLLNQEENENFENSYRNVQSIDLDVDVGSVYIEPGDEFKIVCENINEDRVQARVIGSTWKIKVESGLSNIAKEGFTKINGIPEITIYLPQSFVADTTKIKVDAGYVFIEQLSARDMSIKVNLGNISAENISSLRSNIECNLGNIMLEGQMTGKNTIKTGTGNITLSCDGDSNDYYLSAKTLAGKVVVNNEEATGISKLIETGEKENARHSFIIECILGKIDLQIS